MICAIARGYIVHDRFCPYFIALDFSRLFIHVTFL